ncbi:hypothetical protein [Sorangium sp. So ce233]|uniref:hypothetical protein n=1 Tax=Sorangium sp. So ce233 TaxID=3133290 RepID=UPI003F631DD7
MRAIVPEFAHIDENNVNARTGRCRHATVQSTSNRRAIDDRSISPPPLPSANVNSG